MSPAKTEGMLTAPSSTILVLLLFPTDLALISLWATGTIGDLDSVALHFIASLGALSLLLVLSRSQKGSLKTWGILMLLMGPLGGPALFLAKIYAASLGSGEHWAEFTNVEADELPTQQQWEHIYDQIRQGRRFDPSVGTLKRLVDVFQSDDSELQLAAISVVSRQYSPEMRPALEIALRSPNAALRVQAAAVFAKLRNSFSERAAALLSDTSQIEATEDVSAWVSEVRAVAVSGFVEEAVRKQLLTAAEIRESHASASFDWAAQPKERGRRGEVAFEPRTGDAN